MLVIKSSEKLGFMFRVRDYGKVRENNLYNSVDAW